MNFKIGDLCLQKNNYSLGQIIGYNYLFGYHNEFLDTEIELVELSSGEIKKECLAIFLKKYEIISNNENNKLLEVLYK